jgi:CHASE2 domain-containing sensor protein
VTPLQRRTWRALAAAACGVALISFGPLGPFLARLEYDQLMRAERAATPPGDPLVAVVGLDDAAWRDLTAPGKPGLDRAGFARLLDVVAKAGPKAVAVDVVFAERRDAAVDRALAEAIARCPAPVVAASLRFEVGRAEPQLRAPLPEILEKDVPAGVSNTPPDGDNVVRRIRPRYGQGGARHPHLALEAARRFLGGSEIEVHDARVTIRVPRPGVDAHLGLDASGGMLVAYRGADRFRVVPASALLAASPDPAAMKALSGRLVVVGATTSAGGDLHVTPFTAGRGRNGLMPGPVLLAHAIQGIVADDLVAPMVPAMAVLARWSCAFVAAFVFSLVGPLPGLALLALLAFALATASVALFRAGVLLGSCELACACAGAYVATLIAMTRNDAAPRARVLALERPVAEESAAVTVLASRAAAELAASAPAAVVVERVNAVLACVTEGDGAPAHAEPRGPGRVLACWSATDPAYAATALATARRALADLGDGWHAGVHAGKLVAGHVGTRRQAWPAVLGAEALFADALPGFAAALKVPLVVTAPVRDACLREAAFRELDRVHGPAGVVPLYEPALLEDAAREPLAGLFLEYQGALADYYRMDWKSARERLYRLLERHPREGPARVLLDRIEGFTRTPPADGWGGAVLSWR